MKLEQGQLIEHNGRQYAVVESLDEKHIVAAPIRRYGVLMRVRRYLKREEFILLDGSVQLPPPGKIRNVSER